MKAAIAISTRAFAIAVMLCLVLAACGSQSTTNSSGQTIVNLGYFPNMTHAAALVGVERGTFAQALGSKVQLKTMTFNAGPAEITALLAGDIDIAFVGPSPAISGYVHSHGQALRIIAGASSGGVLFVVRPGANIKTAKDLANKKIADPQLGGTQDVSLRYYLKQNGLTPADKGGNVQIVPTDNATILTLFKEGKIDGAWKMAMSDITAGAPDARVNQMVSMIEKQTELQKQAKKETDAGKYASASDLRSAMTEKMQATIREMAAGLRAVPATAPASGGAGK